MQGDFSRYLAPHESTRWTGQPVQGLVLRSADAAMIPFSLMWGGFAIFWESSVLTSGAPPFMVVWGIPFVLIGLYMIAGRFFGDAYVRSRTSYALTDRRALILSGMFETKLTSVELSTLSELHFKPAANGAGTIIFGPDGNASSFSFGRRSVISSPEFFRIADADRAYALVQKQRAGGRG